MPPTYSGDDANDDACSRSSTPDSWADAVWERDDDDALGIYESAFRVFIYLEFDTGPHLPLYFPIIITDKTFTYKDHPDLCRAFHPSTACLECWNPSGFFYPFDCYRPFDVSCRPYMIILRPQDQPNNYLSACIGFRELTYELYWSPGRFRWTTICKGIAPPDTELSLLNTGCLEYLKETDDWKSGSWDFRDRSMAREFGVWEGDEDEYDSDDYKHVVIRGSMVYFNDFD